MGHIKLGALVSKDTTFGTLLLRCDVPVGESTVTQFVNPSSIYRLTFCSAEIALHIAKVAEPMPVHEWQLPQPALPQNRQEEEPFEE